VIDVTKLAICFPHPIRRRFGKITKSLFASSECRLNILLFCDIGVKNDRPDTVDEVLVNLDPTIFGLHHKRVTRRMMNGHAFGDVLIFAVPGVRNDVCPHRLSNDVLEPTTRYIRGGICAGEIQRFFVTAHQAVLAIEKQNTDPHVFNEVKDLRARNRFQKASRTALPLEQIGDRAEP